MSSPIVRINVSQNWARAQRWLMVVVTLAAFGLRAAQLEEQSLWYDETYSVFVAGSTLENGWAILLADGVHPPLYYGLLKATMALWGDTEFALRISSAMLGALAVPLIYQAGRRWIGARAGIFAALLIAVSPFHVWYSQEARMYALVVPIALGVMLLFERLLTAATRRRRAGFTGLSAVAYVTHYFMLFLPLVQFIYLATHLRRHTRTLRSWVVMQLVAALPLLVWIVALARREGQHFGIGWIPAPGVADLLYTLMNFSTGYATSPSTFHWLGLAAFLTLAVLGLRSRWEMADARAVVGLWAFFPLVLVLLMSFQRPLYVDRFFIFSLPAFLLLVAAGVHSMRGRAAAATAIGALSLSIVGVFQFAFNPIIVKEDWRGAAKYLDRAQADEAIVARVAQGVVPLSYYYDGSLPLEAMEVNRDVTPLAELATGHGGLWLVYWNASRDAHWLAPRQPFDPASETDPVAADWISGRGPALAGRKDFVGITLFHFLLEPAMQP